MGNRFDQTRKLITFKINLSVVLGELDRRIAEVWVDAFNHLNDEQMAELINEIELLGPAQACQVTLKYLMNHYYPFRELILFQTDDAFKRRMGLENLDYPKSYSN